jgi:NAD+ synthase
MKLDRNLKSEKIITDIVYWLKNYTEKNNLKSLNVGVSGGIDSAVVSTICAKTGLQVNCIILPIQQEPSQTKRGENHVNWLKSRFKNVELIKIDLTSIFNHFKESLPYDLQNEVALVNTKSRLRMATLYQIAQSKNGIVVGTGNKVEDFGIGFFTKYGDGGVDISPIADLYKSEVYELAKKLNIIDEIQNAIPTDGLWGDNRDDETQIGATYDELEWAMEHIDKTPHDKILVNLTTREKEVLKIYMNFHVKNKHKMEIIPIYKI